MATSTNGNGHDDDPASWADDFPKTDEYVDFSGRRRVFTPELIELPSGFRLRATERKRGNGGYEFEAFSRVDPIEALADLRKRIPKMLATRATWLVIEACNFDGE